MISSIEEMIVETKEMFVHLKESNDLNLSSVKENIEQALPDMIRNDDVLIASESAEGVRRLYTSSTVCVSQF